MRTTTVTRHARSCRHYLVAAAAMFALACDRPLADPAAPPSTSASVLATEDVAVEVRWSDALKVRRGPNGMRSEAQGRSLAAFDNVARSRRVSSIRSMVTAPDARLDGLRASARRRGAHVPDPASWYVLSVGRDNAASLVEALNALSEVDTAYVAPAPAPAPVRPAVATLDFAPLQTYFDVAPSGVGIDALRGLPGGDGQGVTVVDVEYDWFFSHEDMALGTNTHLGGDLFPLFGADHGTAVLGLLGARANGFGVTGAAPGATLRTSSPITGLSYVPADAIVRATLATQEGDVILLEQQAFGPTGAFVPVEWIPSVYEATRLATLAGRIVVAAAGNGAADLDRPEYEGRFDRARFNSGAIVVGAGSASRERLGFSSYGSRLDVQARGIGVVTTGYGDLSGTSPFDSYTRSFSGTSSASAIVAGVAASLQGFARRRYGIPLSADEMARLLRSTGSPQAAFPSGAIGPVPNVADALAQVDAFAPRLIPIDIAPRQPHNIIPMRGRGGELVTVALLGAPDFDPGEVDVSSLEAGASSAAFVPAVRGGGGAVSVERSDVNHDSRDDVLVTFSRNALVASGALSSGTRSLTVRGMLTSGRRVRGHDVVRLVP